jgi:hypothetical protein
MVENQTIMWPMISFVCLYVLFRVMQMVFRDGKWINIAALASTPSEQPSRLDMELANAGYPYSDRSYAALSSYPWSGSRFSFLSASNSSPNPSLTESKPNTSEDGSNTVGTGAGPFNKQMQLAVFGTTPQSPTARTAKPAPMLSQVAEERPEESNTAAAQMHKVGKFLEKRKNGDGGEG